MLGRNRKVKGTLIAAVLLSFMSCSYVRAETVEYQAVNDKYLSITANNNSKAAVNEGTTSIAIGTNAKIQLLTRYPSEKDRIYYERLLSAEKAKALKPASLSEEDYAKLFDNDKNSKDKNNFLADEDLTPELLQWKQAILAEAAAKTVSNAIAIGSSAIAKNDYAIALGNEAEAVSISAVAIGNSAYAKNESTIAIGKNAQAGHDNTVLANNAIAIGTSAKTYYSSGIALGNEAKSQGTRSIAIGDSAWTYRDEGIAIGSASYGYSYAVAIGVNTSASATNSIALGYDSNSKSRNSISVGYKATSLYQGSIAIGVKASAGNADEKGDADYDAVALGGHSKANSFQTVAIGSYTEANASRALALGAGAKADVENGIALGSRSVANREAGISGWNPLGDTKDSVTWKSNLGAVSVGGKVDKQAYTRQITNVAAGSEDTDAVNVAQLKAVDSKIGVVEADVSNANSSILDLTNSVNTNISTLTDSVNAINDKLDGLSLSSSAKDVTLKTEITDSSLDGKVDENLILTVDTANTDDGSLSAVNYSLRLNSDIRNLSSITFEDSEMAQGMRISNRGVSFGGQVLHGVGAGSSDWDAVNYGQYRLLLERVDYLEANQVVSGYVDTSSGELVLERGNIYGEDGSSIVDNLSSVWSDYGENNNDQTDLKSARYNYDLASYNSNIMLLDLDEDELTNSAATNSDAGIALLDLSSESDAISAVADEGTATSGDESTKTMDTSEAASGIFASDKVISSHMTETVASVYDVKALKNLTINTGLVTQAALAEATSSINDNISAVTTNLTQNVTTLENDLTTTSDNLSSQLAEEVEARKQTDANLEQEIIDRTAADTTLQKAIDKEISDREAAIDYEANTRASEDEAIRALITDNNKEAKALSSKLEEETKTREDADTALSQALATESATREAADTQLSNALNSLDGQLRELDTRMNRVGAGAAALAALHPLDFDPDDKLAFSVGVGHYRGASSGAIGMFYRPDEKTMFSIGGTVGNAENMFNFGLSVGLDRVDKRLPSRAVI
jgi:hypothetical protein